MTGFVKVSSLMFSSAKDNAMILFITYSLPYYFQPFFLTNKKKLSPKRILFFMSCVLTKPKLLQHLFDGVRISICNSNRLSFNNWTWLGVLWDALFYEVNHSDWHFNNFENGDLKLSRSIGWIFIILRRVILSLKYLTNCYL